MNFHGLDGRVSDWYTKRLQIHIAYVQEAGRQLGVPDEQLARHDESKWSAAEFPAYAAYQYARAHKSAVTAEVGNAFAAAWLHHIHHNPHHWQHWIFPDGFAPGAANAEAGVLPMPGHFALEMVADWMGASKAYTGSFDMTEWLSNNMPRIRLHSETADHIRGVLDALGYADVVYMQRWAHEE